MQKPMPQSPTKRGCVLLAILICIISVLACTSVSADDRYRTISQLQHTSWTPKDGAPGVVQALAQTKDGYLWLGAPDGLYRFDGLNFERYEPTSGGPFPAHDVRSLFALPNGDLWIGFAFGAISHLRNGKATNYTIQRGVPNGKVVGLVQDRQGTMWAATTAGLARLEGNRWKEVSSGWNFPGGSAMAVFLDRRGTLWVSTEDTVVSLPFGAKSFQQTGIRVGTVPQIAQAPNGRLWMAETTRSVRPIPLSDHQLPPDRTEIRFGSVAILFARDGSLWITTFGDGLRRIQHPERLDGKYHGPSDALEKFTAKNGLTSDFVRAIFQDREGNIWVGTQVGLDRFRETNLVPVILPFEPQAAVMASGNSGDLWVSSHESTVRVRNGQVDKVKTKMNSVAFGYRDPAGVLWWIGAFAVYRYENGRFTTASLPQEIPKPAVYEMPVTEDHSGVLWLAAAQQGLFYRKNGRWRRFDTAPDLTALTPAFAFTDWTGRLWFGYGGGTIITVDAGRIRTLCSGENSPVGNVKAIGGRSRHIWIGGELGLAYFDGSQFQRMIPADAETFGAVLGVVETSDGALWLCDTRGVIRIASSEVQKFLKTPSYRVNYSVFDSSDGLPGIFQNTGPLIKEIEESEGRLWFKASNGVAWVDPANLVRNSFPPPVVIESIIADSKQYETSPNLKLPAQTRNVQIDYTGLSLSEPERVRFRYELEGVDKGWQDPGTRRQAFYTNLGPGRYRFHVVACNSDGVWNDVGAAVGFNIAAAWYQTNWFLVLCVVAGLLIIWSIHRMRVQWLARGLSARFDERLAERTRVARDLHDVFLQSVQASKMIADDALGGSTDLARMRRAMERVSSWLGQAVEEGRTALNSLRVSTVQKNDLAEALQAAIEECRPLSSMETSFSVAGEVRDMHPVVRYEVYRIGYEAIRNAVLHSGGNCLEVRLTYAHDLDLRVTDNGIGIDPAILEKGKIGHFGLQGMRERAARTGGKLSIISSAKSGTRVTVVIPGRIIFRKPSPTRFERLKANLGWKARADDPD
jgi:signal transduction histidine kinase/ligand-binding sensor domain-containing protein